MKVVHIPTGAALFVLKRIGGNDRLCISPDGRRVVVDASKIREARKTSVKDPVLEEDEAEPRDQPRGLEYRPLRPARSDDVESSDSSSD